MLKELEQLQSKMRVGRVEKSSLLIGGRGGGKPRNTCKGCKVWRVEQKLSVLLEGLVHVMVLHYVDVGRK